MEKYIVGLVLVLILVGGVLGNNKWQEYKLEKAQIAAALAKSEAATNSAALGLSEDSKKIYVSGVNKQRELERIHAENVANIEKSNGAGTVLSDDFIRNLNGGLCRYEATTGCGDD
jgi:hypothetical protein